MVEGTLVEQLPVPDEATVEKNWQQYARYKEMELGKLPEENFKRAMELLERMDQNLFSEDGHRKYERTMMLVEHMAEDAKIKISPEIANLYYILRVNKGEVLVRPGEDKVLPLGEDHKILAEALLMLGDFAGYKKFINHYKYIFKEELKKLQRFWR